jgi:mono/diheme cytochrome c family protein
VLLIGVGGTLAVVYWPFGKKLQKVDERNPATAGLLGSARGSESAPTVAVSPQFAAGRKVFETNNCARCHTIGGSSPGGFGGPPGGGPGMGRARGPDLATVGKDPAHTADWLMEQVRNPKAHKPDARMPSYEGKIKDDDLRALAEYLASLK